MKVLFRVRDTTLTTYRGKVATLADSLNGEACRFEASELLRGGQRCACILTSTHQTAM